MFSKRSCLSSKNFTAHKIFKNHKEIVEYEKQNVEEPLLRWFEQARNLNVTVSNSILKENVISLNLQLYVNNFNPTIGWLTCWKNRNNIVFKRTCEEKNDVDYQAAEDYLNDSIESST